MHIREIEVKDNQQMESIIKASLESVQLNIPGTAYFDPYLGELTEFYQTQSAGKYWVAVNDADEVIGGVGIGPFGDHQGVSELQKLYLAPEAQGKGIAKKLMETALTFAENHYDACYLETFDSLHAANQLYIKFGFEQVNEPLSGSEHSACDSWYMKRF